jgi:signal transduction histidine kinase
VKSGSLGNRVTFATLALLFIVLTGVIAAVTIAYRSSREQDLVGQLRAAGDDFQSTPPGDVMKFLVANLARQGIAVDFEPASGVAATIDPPADRGNPLEPAVQAALDAGTITKSQARALVQQIDAGSIDLQQLVDSGTLTAAEMGALQARLDAAKQPSAVGRQETPLTASVTTRGSLFVLDAVQPDGTHTILSASNDAIDADVRQLLAIEVAVAMVALVLAALLIRWVTGVALKPLAEVSWTATRIADGDTAERLRPARSDTELGSMAAAFDHMVDALEEAVRQAKDAEETMRRFLADASHELRTPIAALQASAETLLREQPRRPRRDALEATLAGDAARLGRLVDDLLGLARLDAAVTGHSTIVDLTRLAETAVMQADRRGPGAAVALEINSPVWVAGDAEALSRVIRNLLDNALTAAGSRGHVQLRVAAAADEAILSVEDDGPGVPVAERERIFDRFVRLAPGSSGGSGLGLAIARRIARQHRGDLTCDEADRGARFTLRLPLAEPRQPVDAAQPTGSVEDPRLVSMSMEHRR